MQLILSSVLPYLVCIALAAISSALWWSKLASPWSFVLFGVLILLGIHQVGTIVLEALNLFSASGQILEYQGQGSAESIARAQSALLAKSIKASLFILVVGGPLLAWLRAVMPKQ